MQEQKLKKRMKIDLFGQTPDYCANFSCHRATSHSIDLHGVGLKEANLVTHEYVDDWWQRERNESPRQPFRIITGRGVHSAQGRARLLPYISQSLAAKGWKIELHNGFITVRGMLL